MLKLLSIIIVMSLSKTTVKGDIIHNTPILLDLR